MAIALIALTIGFTAGLKPGPLGVFVIHQTMARGYRHGLMASLAPIITDGPIILLAIFFSQQATNLDWLIALISLLGGTYMAYIAHKIFTTKYSDYTDDRGFRDSGFIGAIKLNIVNPSPYVFWFTIGSSFMAQGTTTEALIFVAGVFISLSATKFCVAFAIKTLGDRFSSRIYDAMLKFLAIPLIIFSAHLFYRGAHILIQ